MKVKPLKIRHFITWIVFAVLTIASIIWLLVAFNKLKGSTEDFDIKLVIPLAISIVTTLALVVSLPYAFRCRLLTYKVEDKTFYVSAGMTRHYLFTDDQVIDCTISSGFHIPPMSYKDENTDIEVKCGSFGEISFKANNHLLKPERKCPFNFKKAKPEQKPEEIKPLQEDNNEEENNISRS